MKVSVLLLTFNEEANLPRCLDALAWCDDIVAIDSGSTDATLKILEGSGVRVLHRAFDTFAGQRNFGLDQGGLRHAWVLHLDADEVLTPEFVAALHALEPPPKVHGYYIPSKTILFGRWLKHAGMWPSYQARLGSRTHMRFKQVGHGQREDLPASQLSVFPEAYLHYSFSHGMKRWLEKHVKYAQDEAELLCKQPIDEAGDKGGAAQNRRRLKRLTARLPLWLRPPARFCYVYILRSGWRDGHAGFVYAFMLSMYEGMIAIFAYEKRNSSPLPARALDPKQHS